MTYAKDLARMQFGRLTVLHQVPSRIKGHCAWRCRCRCGVELTVLRTNLISETTKSCGCLRKAKLAKLASRHHRSTTRVYAIWKDLVHRKRHRGCPVCDAWLSFETFLDDLGDPRPTQFLCRIDPQEPYCIWNCYWGSQWERYNPAKLPKWHKYHAQWMTLPAICRLEHREQDYLLIYARLRRGDSLHDALR